MTQNCKGSSYPHPSSAAVSAVMRANSRTGTAPELRLRSLLHRRGYRFRKDFPVRAGSVLVRPDIVFSRQRIAVFMDGCYWHCCPEHGTKPRSNTQYWLPKLDRNVSRDRRINEALHANGWAVIRIWEHEPLESAALQVVAAVDKA